MSTFAPGFEQCFPERRIDLEAVRLTGDGPAARRSWVTLTCPPQGMAVSMHWMARKAIFTSRRDRSLSLCQSIRRRLPLVISVRIACTSVLAMRASPPGGPEGHAEEADAGICVGDAFRDQGKFGTLGAAIHQQKLHAIANGADRADEIVADA